MPIDVSDTTFQTEVLDRSQTTPVVVDLWAPWCGPCHQLGPIIEKVVDETAGKVVLAKVNVDENPQVSAAFRVQGIPAVYAVSGGKVVDGFIGAQGETAVREFVDRLLPSEAEEEIEKLVAAGDETSLRQALERQPDHAGAIVALAELLAGRGGEGDIDEALGLLERICRALGEIDLDVRSAKVQTLGDRVVDAFYVRGADGAKVTDPRHMAEVERALLHALDSE